MTRVGRSERQLRAGRITVEKDGFWRTCYHPPRGCVTINWSLKRLNVTRKSLSYLGLRFAAEKQRIDIDSSSSDHDKVSGNALF
jgi:hypothetical protein